MTSNSIKTAVRPEVFKRHIHKSLSGSEKERYDDFIGTLARLNKKFMFCNFFAFISLAPALFLLLAMISPLIEVGFTQAYANAPVIFYLFAGFLAAGVIAFAVLFVLRKKTKIAAEQYLSENQTQIEKILENNFDFGEMKNVSIDYFEVYYSAEKGMKKPPYTHSCDIHYDENSIYYLDDGTVIKIPKSEFVNCEMVEEKVTFYSTVPGILSKENREYGIKSAGNSGLIMSKSYGLFLFSDGKETFAIEVLPNSYESFKSLFGR